MAAAPARTSAGGLPQRHPLRPSARRAGRCSIAASSVSASASRARSTAAHRCIHFLDAVGEHQVGSEETLADCGRSRVPADPSASKSSRASSATARSPRALADCAADRSVPSDWRVDPDQRVDFGDPVVLALTGGDVAWMGALDFEECTRSGMSAFGESPRRGSCRSSFGLFLPHHVCRCGHDPDEQHVERETKGPAFHDRLPWLISESYYSRRIVKVAAIINPISGAGADVHAAERRMAMVREELERAEHARSDRSHRPAPAMHTSSRAAPPTTGPISSSSGAATGR